MSDLRESSEHPEWWNDRIVQLEAQVSRLEQERAEHDARIRREALEEYHETLNHARMHPSGPEGCLCPLGDYLRALARPEESQ